MTLKIDVLETSFQSIAPKGETFVTAFYEGAYEAICSIMLERPKWVEDH